MFKSLILSALLSFGSVSYEFDCTEMFLTRNNLSDSYSLHIDYISNGEIDDFDVMFLTLSNIDSSSPLLDFDNDFIWDDDVSVFNLYVESLDDYGGVDLIKYEHSSSCVYLECDNGDLYGIRVYEDDINYYYEGSLINDIFSIYITDDVDLTLSYADYLMISSVFSDYISSDSSILSEIGDVLMWVPGQFVTLFSTLTAVFYADGALTLPGLFLVIGLGVFICALILDFILKFRNV